MSIVPIRSNASPQHRLLLAVEALSLVVGEIEDLSNGLTKEQVRQIDAAETRLARLRAGIRTKTSMQHLCGLFGRTF